MNSDMPDIPEAFLHRMNQILDSEEADWLAASLKESPSVSIRFNRMKNPDPDTASKRFAQLNPQRVDWCESGYYLDSRPDFVLDPYLHAGAYYVQEAASMYYESLVSDILSSMNPNVSDSIRILDMCAAPGGKSTAMLNALDKNYLLVANEYEGSRASILKENLDKWGDPNVIVTSSPASDFGKLINYFDIIAVDAPCSGEGMMRREPKARSQWSERLTEQCALLQQDIVEQVMPALRPGGVLIYSTCTFNTLENENNCEIFVNRFDLEPLYPSRRFMPHRVKCEGLFVAAFRKPFSEGFSVKKIKSKKEPPVKLPKDNLFLSSADLEFIKRGDKIYALPPMVAECYRYLGAAGINIISAGVETGTIKGNILIPSSRQVLSQIFDAGSLPLAELTLQEAQDYIRRQPLALNDDVPKGYVCVCFEGKPLGLVKNIGARANNLYPSEWKVFKK